MKVEKTEIEIVPARPAVTEEQIVLTLSRKEAEVLFRLSGRVSGGGPVRDTTDELYATLRDALGVPHGGGNEVPRFFLSGYNIQIDPTHA